MVDELSFGQDELHHSCQNLKLAIGEQIITLHDKGVSDFLTTAEYGFPLFAAEAVLATRLLSPDNPPRLHVIMPHEGQAHRWSDSVRERFYDIHEAADSVTMLATQFTDECYIEADEFMMKRSIMLLTDGGNAELLKLARTKNKHIERIPTPARMT
jgi:uncharacterized phage-like protein YoqJ